MGFFSKIKKGFGKIFSPIVKGLDKITGGGFSKIMNNKWVKYALIAVAVVTGGIAIANGIMAAGQAGVGAAAKAFATNMSMETGKTLLGAVVEGGKQFVVGVAKGLANPMGSDAGKALTGMFDSAAGNIAGTAVTGPDQLAEASASGVSAADSAAQAGLDAGSGALNVPGVTPSSAGTVAQPAGSGAGLSVPGMPQSATISPGAATGAFDPSTFAGSSGSMLETGASALPDDLLSQLANGAKSVGGAAMDYAKSPQGMYQIGSSLQGWAQGQALQERWDQMDDIEKKRYRSWVDGPRMPRMTADPVTM